MRCSFPAFQYVYRYNAQAVTLFVSSIPVLGNFVDSPNCLDRSARLFGRHEDDQM